MAEQITLTDITNPSNDTSVATAINSNNATVEAAFLDVLSLSGVAPNQMLSNLDMNNNQIINLPAPATADSPARLQDLSTITGGGTVSSIPSGGTTGQVLAKSSNTNYATEWASTGSAVTAGTNISIVGGAVSTVTNPNFSTSVTTPSLILNGTTTSGTTGSGNTVLATSPAISGLTVTGSLSATGLVTNADLAGSIAATKLTGTDINTVGTITTGTWNGTAIIGTYIGTNTVANANLVQMGAATLQGNPTAGTTNASAFTIQGLSNNSSPSPSNDKILIYNNTTGTIQYCTPNQIVSAGTAGVSTLNGLSGAVTIPSTGNISVSAGSGNVTVSVNTTVANSWTTNAQTFSPNILRLLGSSTGYTTLNSGLSSTGNNTLTLPTTSSDTLAGIGTAQVWSAAQSFPASGVLLKGSSTGYTTFFSDNASSTAYLLHFPAANDTITCLAATQSLTNKTLTSSTNVLGGVTMTLGSDATGDIYYRNSSTFLNRLGVGSNGKILAAVSSLPAYVSGAYLTNTGLGAPTGSTSTSGVMMGLGTTVKITPNYSGKVVCTIQGYCDATTAGGVEMALFQGSGTAPSNQAATAGAQLTAYSLFSITGQICPFSVTGITTGLTVGTSYWFDINLINTTGTGTSNIGNLSCVVYEIP